MKIKKTDELTLCQECGRKQNDNRPIYEMDFGTTHIQALYLCKECMNRLWVNIDLLIDED